LLPDASATVQQLAGKVAISTATNGGDFGKALTDSLISAGTGFLGSEIASETGSKLVGQLTSSTLNSAAHGQDINLGTIGTSLLGSTVASEITDATGSNLAGKVAGSITKDVINDKDVGKGLLTLGANELGNVATGQINDYVDKTALSGQTTGTDSDTNSTTLTGNDNNQTVTNFGNSTDVSDIVDSINSANDTKTNDVKGALTTVSGTDSTTNNASTSDNTVDGTLTTGGTNVTKEEGNDIVVTGGTPTTTGTDTTTGTVTVTGVNADGSTTPVGGLTTATNNLLATDTTGGNTAATTTGGLNTLAQNTDTVTGGTGNDTVTGVTGTDTVTSGAGTSNVTSGLGGALVKNLIKDTTKKVVGSTARGAINSAVTGKKMTAMPSVAKTLTGSALSAIQKAAPKTVDISKLSPVTKSVPVKMDVSKLRPLTNIAGLTSLLKKPG
jgi:hypothetical protein